MIADYHMHLERGGLDPDYLRRFVETAVARGVDEICITEHAYHFPEAAALLGKPGYVAARSRGYDIDAYIDLILSARAQGLPVRLGIEMDYIPGAGGGHRPLPRGPPLGPGDRGGALARGLGLRPGPRTWGRARRDRRLPRNTSRLAEQAVASGLFDIFAHPDVIKVFGARPDPGFDSELLAW